MEAFYDYRPLVIAIIEYGLVGYVLATNSKYKNIIAAIIFLLATYQLGEVFIINTEWETFGKLVSIISTTFLPTTGLYLFEKIHNKTDIMRYLFVIPIAFAIGILIQPGIFNIIGTDHCFVKYAGFFQGSLFTSTWGVYYVSFLILGMALSFLYAFKEKNKKKRKLFKYGFLAYFSFFPISYLLIWFCNINGSLITSLMCSLALIGAFILYLMAREG